MQRDLPRPELHGDPQAGGQRPRDVVEPAAAGNVREGERVPAGCAQRATQDPDLVEIGPMRLEQRLSDRPLQARRRA